MWSRRLEGVRIALWCVFLPHLVRPSLVVDLSYQPRLKASTLAAAISDLVWEGSNKNEGTIEVDVSSSLLGDDGIEKVMQSLLPTDKTIDRNNGHEKTVHLSARMNRLSPFGVARILQSISNRKIATDTNHTDGNMTSTENDINVLYLHSLDVGWNDLNPEATGSKTFLLALRSLIEDPERCPQVVRLDQCGLTPASCRAIGKGIMNRFAKDANHDGHKPLSLHFCGNEAVGDAGAAALAAALRTSKPSDTNQKRADNAEALAIFEVLDLSSCGIGDDGVDALAMALESNPCCIRHLDLSSNHISDDGAASLATALAKASLQQGQGRLSLESLDLSNNKEIGDRGAAALATLFEKGGLKSVSLRSCHVHADGAKAFGQALKGLTPFTDTGKDTQRQMTRKVDLSGNPLGVLRGKTKSGGKYSATKLKSKASATASSYMSFIGKNIRSGLKDVGLDVAPLMGSSSVESDDDEEEKMGVANGDSNSDMDPSKVRCGAKSFANEVLGIEDESKRELQDSRVTDETVRFELAMRHCFLDRGGADALAAAVMQAKERFGIALEVDARMNNVLEYEMVAALRGDEEHSSTLEEMSERHLEAMETLRISEERAAEAAAAASSRMSSFDNHEWNDQGDVVFGGFNPYDNDNDSDAIYDDNDEYDY